MLKKEEERYAFESLEVPKIQFFDNNLILGTQKEYLKEYIY